MNSIPISGRQRWVGLQGLRAVAVAVVLLSHLGVGKGGFIGVHVFFVLSGFVITNLLLNRMHDRSLNLREFFVRRFSRIAPAATVSVLITTVAAFAFQWGAYRTTALGFVTSIFFVSNLAAALTNHFLGWVNYTWSLAQEEQYYLIVPWLLRRLQATQATLCRVGLVAAICIAAFRIALCAAFPELSPTWYTAPALNADGLILGTVLCLRLRLPASKGQLRLFKMMSRPAIVMVTAISVVTYSLLGTPSGVSLGIGPVLGAAFAVSTIVNVVLRPGGCVDNTLSSSSMAWVGDRSYGIYVYQVVTIEVVYSTLREESELAAGLISVFCVAVIAHLSFRYFENPIRGVLDRRLLADRPRKQG